MNAEDIVFLKCYSEDYKKVFSNFIHKEPVIKIELSFKPYDLANSRILIVRMGLELTFNHDTVSISTTNEFVIMVENFNAQFFYAKELDSIVEIVSCAYSNSRIMFFNEYSHTANFHDIYLPFMSSVQFRELLASTDVYNKL